MRDRKTRIRCLKKAITNTKKIGVRSISDIISNSKMCFSRKVNYIRHHYTYYEGNYDLFVNTKGQPNSRKMRLNSLIIDIINGKKDASELKDFNKKILDWRKDADDLAQQKKEELLEYFDGSTIKEKMQWEKDICGASATAKSYIEIINAFLNQHENEKSLYKDKSYKEMKKIALKWQVDSMILNDNKKVEDMTPGEYFRYNYLSRLQGTDPSSYLDLICMYLDSKENKKYKKELLETKKIDAIKEEAIQWAILKVIDKDEDVINTIENCSSKVKNRIKARAGVFEEKDEDKRAYKLMKQYAEDLGYIEKEVVNG